MKRLPISNVSYGEVEITLDGERYTIVYRYNSRSQRWKIDIIDSDDVYVLRGGTLVEQFSPTAHLKTINFNNGMLYVAKSKATSEPAGRNNIGLDNDYELLYVSFSEL